MNWVAVIITIFILCLSFVLAYEAGKNPYDVLWMLFIFAVVSVVGYLIWEGVKRLLIKLKWIEKSYDPTNPLL